MPCTNKRECQHTSKEFLIRHKFHLYLVVPCKSLLDSLNAMISARHFLSSGSSSDSSTLSRNDVSQKAKASTRNRSEMWSPSSIDMPFFAYDSFDGEDSISLEGECYLQVTQSTCEVSDSCLFLFLSLCLAQTSLALGNLIPPFMISYAYENASGVKGCREHSP